MKTTGFRPTETVQSILDEKKKEGINISEYLNNAVIDYEESNFAKRWVPVENELYFEAPGVNFKPIGTLSCAKIGKFYKTLLCVGLQQFSYGISLGLSYAIYAPNKEIADAEFLKYFNIKGGVAERTNYPLPKIMYDIERQSIKIISYEPVQSDKC